MSEHNWLKYGVIALGAIGFVVILVLMLNFGRGLEGPTWVVQEMSVDGTMTAPISEAPPFAVFEDGTVAGSSGCNSYNGTYQIDADSMTIGPLASTLMALRAVGANRQLRSEWGSADTDERRHGADPLRKLTCAADLAGSALCCLPGLLAFLHLRAIRLGVDF